MPVIFNEALKVFKLDTPHSTYAFKISPAGFLLHLYYGASVPDVDLDYLRQYIRASTTSALTAHEDAEGYMSLDTARLEFPCEGAGDMRIVQCSNIVYRSCKDIVNSFVVK